MIGITDKQAYCRAVKNRLCRIQDQLNKALISDKSLEYYKREIITVTASIDECVESLEKLLKIL